MTDAKSLVLGAYDKCAETGDRDVCYAAVLQAAATGACVAVTGGSGAVFCGALVQAAVDIGAPVLNAIGEIIAAPLLGILPTAQGVNDPFAYAFDMWVKSPTVGLWNQSCNGLVTFWANGRTALGLPAQSFDLPQAQELLYSILNDYMWIPPGWSVPYGWRVQRLQNRAAGDHSIYVANGDYSGTAPVEGAMSPHGHSEIDVNGNKVIVDARPDQGGPDASGTSFTGTGPFAISWGGMSGEPTVEDIHEFTLAVADIWTQQLASLHAAIPVAIAQLTQEMAAEAYDASPDGGASPGPDHTGLAAPALHPAPDSEGIGTALAVGGGLIVAAGVGYFTWPYWGPAALKWLSRL